MNHLPDGANYGFVEIDMSSLVSPSVFREFEKQINYRERHRQRKKEKEDVYAGNVDTIQEAKFEKIKREAVNLVNTQAYNLKPGVVRNVFMKQDAGISDGDEEEKTE